MQMKTFDDDQRQTVPIDGVRNLTIENTENREENFHGMRFQGRIIIDNDVVGFTSGYITLMCIPNDQITIPEIKLESVLNDSNSFIIAVMPYQLFSAATGTENRYGAVKDFEIVPATSRTCMKGGKIVGQISVHSGSVESVVVTSLLSLFRTVT